MQEELFSLFETLSATAGDEKKSEARKEGVTDIPLLVFYPRQLIELLQICTAIVQGQQYVF